MAAASAKTRAGSAVRRPAQWFLASRRRGSWQVSVRNDVARLRAALEIALTSDAARALPEAKNVRRSVERSLAEATKMLGPAGRGRLIRDWYSGVAVETALTSVQRAGEQLMLIQPPAALAATLPEIDAGVELNLTSDDPRKSDFRDAIGAGKKALWHGNPSADLDPLLRSRLVAARRAANAALYAAQVGVRKWRNALVIAGACVFVATLTVAALNRWVDHDFLCLTPTPNTTGASGESHRALAHSAVARSPAGCEFPYTPWSIELLGAVGGTIAAVLALNRFKGFTDPFGLPTAQAILRIPASAATALLGVLLMQTSVLELFQPQTGNKVLAFAAVFGYAQEPLLRMVDRKAGEVLAPARSKDEPGKQSADKLAQG